MSVKICSECGKRLCDPRETFIYDRDTHAGVKPIRVSGNVRRTFFLW